MILEIILVLLVLLLVTSCYIIWNLTMKLETLEDWIVNFMDAAEITIPDAPQSDEILIAVCLGIGGRPLKRVKPD